MKVSLYDYEAFRSIVYGKKQKLDGIVFVTVSDAIGIRRKEYIFFFSHGLLHNEYGPSFTEYRYNEDGFLEFMYCKYNLIKTPPPLTKEKWFELISTDAKKQVIYYFDELPDAG